MKEYSFRFKIGSETYEGKVTANSKEDVIDKLLKKICYTIVNLEMDTDSEIEEDDFLDFFKAVLEKEGQSLKMKNYKLDFNLEEFVASKEGEDFKNLIE